MLPGCEPDPAALAEEVAVGVDGGDRQVAVLELVLHRAELLHQRAAAVVPEERVARRLPAQLDAERGGEGLDASGEAGQDPLGVLEAAERDDLAHLEAGEAAQTAVVVLVAEAAVDQGDQGVVGDLPALVEEVRAVAGGVREPVPRLGDRAGSEPPLHRLEPVLGQVERTGDPGEVGEVGVDVELLQVGHREERRGADLLGTVREPPAGEDPVQLPDEPGGPGPEDGEGGDAVAPGQAVHRTIPVFSRYLAVLRKVRSSASARAGDSSRARRSSCGRSRPASR